jgi:hypothetical protein
MPRARSGLSTHLKAGPTAVTLRREVSAVPRARFCSSRHRCLCRESLAVPRGSSVPSRHSTSVPRVFSVPRARSFALSKASLCREIWIWLSAQSRALGRGCVSGKKKGILSEFTLNPGNGDTILHKQSTGGCVRLELYNIFTSSSCSSFLFLSNIYSKGEHMSYSASVGKR